jgi:hypothetical protein
MWPSKHLGTPTVPSSDAVLTLTGLENINAPASLVFDTIRRVDQYESWNHFCPRAEIESSQDSDLLEKGTIFHFWAVMDSAKPEKQTDTRLIVSDVSLPTAPSNYVPTSTMVDGGYTDDLSTVYRISWKGEGGFASKGLKSERFHEVIIKGENACEVRTWEVMGGVLAHTVKWFYKKTLQEKFTLWCTDLKRECERQYAAAGNVRPTGIQTAAAAVPS